MQDQILEILKREKLSASQFADKIGVQRSSVSHVISGRNKPGFEFIKKILETFPRINADWLIRGSGDIYKIPPSQLTLDALSTENSQEVTEPAPLNDEKSVPGPSPSLPRESGTNAGDQRNIERIIVFYSDKTFREYLAES